MSSRSAIFVFPGQGSQAVGMAKDFYDSFSVVKQTFQEADDTLKVNLTKMILEGPDDHLTQTMNAQPAILTVSTAIYRWLRQTFDLSPNVVCGHSLGEYSALVAAEAISFAEAVSAVRLRGQYMQEAVPQGVGTMAAILGADDAMVEDVCRHITEKGFVVEPANYNCPGQLVISGSVEGVHQASVLCKERGALKIVPLKVSAPFHSSMLKPAGERLRPHLEGCSWKSPKFPYVANVHAQEVSDTNSTVSWLADQVWKPVLWSQSLKGVFEKYPDMSVVEVGPGKVISGHIKKIDRQRKVLSADTIACEAQFHAFVEETK